MRGRPRSQQVCGNIKSKLLADVAPGCPISIPREPRQKAGDRVEAIETEVDKYSQELWLFTGCSGTSLGPGQESMLILLIST